ncbi:MAG: helix-turn-helix domain-containing protein, partial [Burkholderiaceae bacterium]
ATEVIEAQLPGEVLAKRRKEFRLSLEDVSSRLKISQRQIIALESNDFGQLASMQRYAASYAPTPNCWSLIRCR